MKYVVEHNQGTQGVNERTIETVEVEAASEQEAIEYVAGKNSPTAPEDSGYGGKWVDYWCASPVEVE